MKRWSSIAASAFVLVVAAHAQTENSLTRDEVSVVKKKLVAVADALGEPPQGYAKTEESFSLPTEASVTGQAGRFNPVDGSANLKFGSASEKKGKKTGEDLQKDYQKKILEEQSKGDYQLMAQLSKEMAQKASKASLEAIEGQKEPILASISFSSNSNQTIDPDAVLFESPGVIALKFSGGVDEAKGRVIIYFDPVNLKNSKTLSAVNLKEPDGGVTKKNVVKNIVIELSGPNTDIQAWAKRISAKKVLAQID